MRHLSLAVVGVQFPNKRGPTRRFAIDLCRPGDPIQLVPEPKNPADQNAIMILNREGMQMGYVSAERTMLIHRAWRDALDVVAIFQGHDERGGAWIRVGFDGEVPELPEERETPARKGDDDSGFYPDPEWPD